MSAEQSTGTSHPRQRLFRQTAVAIRGALSRRDGQATALSAGLVYLFSYLVGVGHLGLGPWGLELTVVSDPIARATQLQSPFQWEPVALLVAGPVELLISPLNVVLGGALAVLVGVNLGVSLVAYRGPTACRLGPGASTAAGVPGLLSGFACCGPTVLLVVGIQASTTVLTVFQWLLPLTVVMLVGTLLWVGSKVDPER